MKRQTVRSFLSAILAAACLTALAGCDQAAQTAGAAPATSAAQAETESGGPSITVQRAAATQANRKAA